MRVWAWCWTSLLLNSLKSLLSKTKHCVRLFSQEFVYSFYCTRLNTLFFFFKTINSSLSLSIENVIASALQSHQHHCDLQYESLTISPTRTMFSPLTRKIPLGMSPYFPPTCILSIVSWSKRLAGTKIVVSLATTLLYSDMAYAYEIS